MQAQFLGPNHTIFGGDISTSILMMDTLIELQTAEIEEVTDEFELREKSVNFMNNLGNAVSNLLDDDHLAAWEDMPKEEWATKAGN